MEIKSRKQRNLASGGALDGQHGKLAEQRVGYWNSEESGNQGMMPLRLGIYSCISSYPTLILASHHHHSLIPSYVDASLISSATATAAAMSSCPLMQHHYSL